MESDEPTPKERKMVHDQIMLSARITMGVTIIAVGLSIHLTSIFFINVNPTLFWGLVGAFVTYEAVGIYFLATGLRKANKRYGSSKKPTPEAKQ